MLSSRMGRRNTVQGKSPRRLNQGTKGIWGFRSTPPGVASVSSNLASTQPKLARICRMVCIATPLTTLLQFISGPKSVEPEEPPYGLGEGRPVCFAGLAKHRDGPVEQLVLIEAKSACDFLTVLVCQLPV